MDKETRLLGITMQKKEMAVEIENRAKSRHISTANYCRVILSDWLVSCKKRQLQER